MRKDIKKKMIGIRVSEKEKRLIEESAQVNGFHSVSSYILWLVKKHGKKS
ncbi:MAG: DUF1778 domain-containing protein [Candidatus Omnitrophica bacterium]|nr:DUF1778 domain-containing protein [Candidatus Omnitrophota bacterium]